MSSATLTRATRGTFSDRMIMEGDPFVLIEGMTIAARVRVGATQGYIYLRSEYPHALRTLNEAIDAAYRRGYLGDKIAGSAHSVRSGSAARRRRLHLRRGDRDAREPRGQARHGALQTAGARDLAGCSAQPTVVNNVVSLATVPIILERGAAFYQRLRDGPLARHAADPARRQHQASGPGREGLRRHAARPGGRLWRRHGAGVRCGPSRSAGRSAPISRRVMLDLPMDYEAFAAKKGIVGHGGIVVFDDTVDLARQAR